MSATQYSCKVQWLANIFNSGNITVIFSPAPGAAGAPGAPGFFASPGSKQQNKYLCNNCALLSLVSGLKWQEDACYLK